MNRRDLFKVVSTIPFIGIIVTPETFTQKLVRLTKTVMSRNSVGNAIDHVLKFQTDARWDVVARLQRLMIAGFKKKDWNNSFDHL